MLNIKPSFPLRREFVKGVKEPPTKPKIWYILLTYTYLLDILGSKLFSVFVYSPELTRTSSFIKPLP